MLYPVTHARGLLQGLLWVDMGSHETIAWTFEHQATVQPDAVFLCYGDRRFRYGEANALINRHAHAYRACGVGRGDVVALMLENRPEFLWHFFGLAKLGAVASLINTQLQAEPLLHALRICRPSHVIVGSEVWSTLEPLRAQLDLSAERVLIDDDETAPVVADVPRWGERLVSAAETNPIESAAHTLADQAAFIYTSGTTGLPKAAIVRHHRFYRGGRVWAGAAFAFRSGDVLYNCLPLYHANSILLATASVVTAGVTMALARRFSRTRFWDDVRRHEATAFVYIGELCRYLLGTEPRPREREHRVRVISGNGLRPSIWRSFQRRFGIRRIVEFYGATESNCVTLNVLGLPGTVGPMLRGMALARWDEASGEFVRDANGRLVRAAVGEPGVLLGKVRPRAEFDGYQDKRASEGKLLRDVFAPGDAWFNTGDLLRVDKLRHLHFVDRLGDTYRWKGENVATLQVQEQLALWERVQEANVYGVTVPGAEGRAGMAAIVLKPGVAFDPAGLRAYVEARLPNYARPRLLRLTRELDTTSTLKLKKTELQKQGYDPRQLGDPLYVLHPQTDQYVPLTPELYDQLKAGQLQL